MYNITSWLVNFYCHYQYKINFEKIDDMRWHICSYVYKNAHSLFPCCDFRIQTLQDFTFLLGTESLSNDTGYSK